MIKIKNVYYMLSYAFQVLKQDIYKSCLEEEFSNIYELFSEILVNGIKSLVKRGISKSYILSKEQTSNPKGKFNITDSIKDLSIKNRQLVCEYDDFSSNNYLNQILKTTCQVLIKSNISNERRKKIKKVLIYFNNVNVINLKNINWRIQYNRNNQTYKMLMYICFLTVKGLIQTYSKSSVGQNNFIDEQNMHRLYEKFILEFYKKEYPFLKVSSSQIKWDLDDNNNMFLPKMISDVLIEKDDKILIIDAKYYTYTMQKQFEKYSIHSNNLYQIYTYVKNKNIRNKIVSGLLLYAKTDEIITPNVTYSISGNKIFVKTLDLNCDFNNIKQQLNDILIENGLIKNTSNKN